MLIALPSVVLTAALVQGPLADDPSADDQQRGSTTAAEEWSRLDEEVEALTTMLREDEASNLVNIWGFLRVVYARSDDIESGGGNDLGGFVIDAARVNVEGQRRDFSYRVDAEWFQGTIALIQAYTDIPLSKKIRARVGQFRVPFLRTGLIEADRRLFLFPTRNGQFYALADLSRTGAMFMAREDRFEGQLAVQNGLDLVGDDLLVSGRLTWNAMGQGVGLIEGAWGAPAGTNASFGVAFSDDQSLGDGLAVSVEGALTRDRLALQAEVVDYEEGYSGADMILFPGVDPESTRGDTTPFSLTASYVLGEDEQHELAVRLDDFDDGLDRKLRSIGWNHYFEGHDAKLQVNYIDLDSDGGDEQIAAVGISLSF